jgi:hypothetical protein
VPPHPSPPPHLLPVRLEVGLPHKGLAAQRALPALLRLVHHHVLVELAGVGEGLFRGDKRKRLGVRAGKGQAKRRPLAMQHHLRRRRPTPRARPSPAPCPRPIPPAHPAAAGVGAHKVLLAVDQHVLLEAALAVDDLQGWGSRAVAVGSRRRGGCRGTPRGERRPRVAALPRKGWARAGHKRSPAPTRRTLPQIWHANLPAAAAPPPPPPPPPPGAAALAAAAAAAAAAIAATAPRMPPGCAASSPGPPAAAAAAALPPGVASRASAPGVPRAPSPQPPGGGPRLPLGVGPLPGAARLGASGRGPSSSCSCSSEGPAAMASGWSVGIVSEGKRQGRGDEQAVVRSGPGGEAAARVPCAPLLPRNALPPIKSPRPPVTHFSTMTSPPPTMEGTGTLVKGGGRAAESVGGRGRHPRGGRRQPCLLARGGGRPSAGQTAGAAGRGTHHLRSHLRTGPRPCCSRMKWATVGASSLRLRRRFCTARGGQGKGRSAGHARARASARGAWPGPGAAMRCKGSPRAPRAGAPSSPARCRRRGRRARRAPPRARASGPGPRRRRPAAARRSAAARRGCRPAPRRRTGRPPRRPSSRPRRRASCRGARARPQIGRGRRSVERGRGGERMSLRGYGSLRDARAAAGRGHMASVGRAAPLMAVPRCADRPHPARPPAPLSGQLWGPRPRPPAAGPPVTMARGERRGSCCRRLACTGPGRRSRRVGHWCPEALHAGTAPPARGGGRFGGAQSGWHPGGAPKFPAPRAAGQGASARRTRPLCSSPPLHWHPTQVSRDPAPTQPAPTQPAPARDRRRGSGRAAAPPRRGGPDRAASACGAGFRRGLTPPRP